MKNDYNIMPIPNPQINLDYDYDLIALSNQYAIGLNGHRIKYKKTICSDSDLEKITKLEEDFFKKIQSLNKNSKPKFF